MSTETLLIEIANIKKDIKKMKQKEEDTIVIAAGKVGKNSLANLAHDTTGIWSFTNIKVSVAYDKTYYQQVSFEYGNYVLDDVDYSTDSVDGKIVDIRNIKSFLIYFNKTGTNATSFLVKYYNSSGVLTTDTNNEPGVYIYQRGQNVNVSGSDVASHIHISPFLD